MVWKVVATVEKSDNGWKSCPQVPTFWVEAYDSSAACKLANMILNPHGDCKPHYAIYCQETGEYYSVD